MTLDSNSHSPLVDRALIGLDLAAEHHLSNCPCCQEEREKTERALLRYADFQREEANRPQSFWEEQGSRIRASRTELKQATPYAAVLVPALVLLLALSGVVGSRRGAQAPTLASKPQIVSDHDLLLEVERAVNNGTPYALEPVALTVDEGIAASSVAGQKSTKEFTHAE